MNPLVKLLKETKSILTCLLGKNIPNPTNFSPDKLSSLQLIKLLVIIFSLTSISVFSTTSISYAQEPSLDSPKAAIIIDDFGGETGGVKDFFDSDIPITFAIMPFLEHSTEQAKKANELGFEVIIHMPLEPKRGKRSWLGPSPITSDLSTEEVKKRVRNAIEDVPHAKGLNNHMGSKIVGDERIMRAIMEVAKEHELYVIDSGTNPKSVIPQLAQEMNIPFEIRDRFIDDSMSSRNHVYRQMVKVCELAKDHGEVIAIGHVGVKGIDTFNGINDSLPYFVKNNVQIVPASHLIETKIEQEPDKFWQGEGESDE
ncbi:divergent polysaccharide deacetylase family protein [Bacillus shivajii]|uniref:divergent polysaccharide deacetylase family protein n=1 Tax=Bacillus shivajii TaxID=1983719 RepID=UPI001CFB3261|nr:divergent polysaccharide deacetylase family protein [Bacillus shivajii]UCZ54651.1 divergent polysaccharide deacetylase family protein [Bacillus shivajii]